MPHAHTLEKISTNVRFSAARWLAPEIAGAWAERLFLTPPRPRYAGQSALDLIDAKSRLIEHKGRSIAAWQWGANDAPAAPSECAITAFTPPWCQASSAKTSAKSGSPVSLPPETPCAGWS